MATYQNDPNINRRNDPAYRDETSYTGWIIGAVVLLALIIGGFAYFNRDAGERSTATDTTRPAATTTAQATTGTGATAPAPGASGSGTR